jgi:hypothetical protein
MGMGSFAGHKLFGLESSQSSGSPRRSPPPTTKARGYLSRSTMTNISHPRRPARTASGMPLSRPRHTVHCKSCKVQEFLAFTGWPGLVSVQAMFAYTIVEPLLQFNTDDGRLLCAIILEDISLPVFDTIFPGKRDLSPAECKYLQELLSGVQLSTNERGMCA